MDNYADFYCGECEYYDELYDRRRDDTKTWCNVHNNRVSYDNRGCAAFKLSQEWEGEEDE